MKNVLITLLISAMFLAPFSSYAATVDEQRQVIVLQLITLLEQQIAALQSQLAHQQTGVTATSTPIQAATTSETNTWTCTYVRELDYAHRTCGD